MTSRSLIKFANILIYPSSGIHSDSLVCPFNFYCEVIECVFLFVGLQLIKLRRSREYYIRYLHSPEQIVKEWFLSTVKGHEFISHSGHFRCLWEAWSRDSELFNARKCFLFVLNIHLRRLLRRLFVVIFRCEILQFRKRHLSRSLNGIED